MRCLSISITLASFVLLAACTGGTDPAPPDPGAGALSPTEQTLLATINGERTSRGLTPVVLRDDLVCAAHHHSMDIGSRSECSHNDADGSGPGERVSACGGPGWSGEIVACGQTTPREAVDGWLGSPGHKAIMLDPDQRQVGVAMYGNYWTAIFGK
jgi:uncharacterized protein YkwD